MRIISILVAFLATTAAYGQIIAPGSVEEHMPIVCRSDGDADVYIWRISAPAKRLTVLNGKACHVWAPPGTYSVELTTITIVIDWEAKTKDVQYQEHQATLIVGDGTPEPPPPEPTPNPYTPDAALQAAVAPVRVISLEVADSHKLAEMYHTVASQARAGAYSDLGQVRSELIKRGTALSLRGKYPGLSQAVERYLTDSLGLEREVKAERVGDTLETLAWAVWRAE